MSKHPFPDEWTEADRECRSAARGLGFVMVIALGDSLHDIRALLDETVDEAVYEGMTISRYAAEIARLLGL